MNDKRATLSAKILKKAFGEAGYEELIKKYDANKSTFKSYRRDFIEQPVTEEEKKFVEMYFTDLERPVRELASRAGVTEAVFNQRVTNACRKIAYKNR